MHDERSFSRGKPNSGGFKNKGYVKQSRKGQSPGNWKRESHFEGSDNWEKKWSKNDGNTRWRTDRKGDRDKSNLIIILHF